MSWVLILCFSGFSFLALATRRIQDELFINSIPQKKVLILRTIGLVLLLLSWAHAVKSSMWLLGTVQFLGAAHPCAGIVLLFIILIRRYR
ncbi:DUF3325 family protein [Comamonas testosteroni]|uniref:DUF3325 family protein n=1 Tax=Comamonas testosteroni TaxID=285 RepID=UPI00389A214B